MPVKWTNVEDEYKSKDHIVDSILSGFYYLDVVQWLPSFPLVVELQKA
jgi:hypothetical protein